MWDFCRAVDDAVDEPGRTGSGRRRSTQWRDGGRTPATTGVSRRRRRECAWQPFIVSVRASAVGLRGSDRRRGDGSAAHRYDTFDALRQYCRRVASAVGLICVEIFGYRDVQTRDYAIDLGIALQLTNIIRDVAPDLSAGRCTCQPRICGASAAPRTTCERASVTTACASCSRFRWSARRRFYRQGRRGAAAPRRARSGGRRIMGAIYFELLRAIERAGYDVFSRRDARRAAAPGGDRRDSRG